MTETMLEQPAKQLLDRPGAMRLLTLAVFGGAWEFGAWRSDALMIPGFGATIAAAVRMLGTSEFWSALMVSNQALVLGFIAAVVTGIPIGLAMGRFRWFEQFSDIYVSILLVTPMAALVPLILMALGIGLTSRVLLVYVFSIVMIIVQTRTGIRQVDAALIEMARSFGADERRMWSEILIPSSIPAIMTGIRLGLGRAITGMVIGELLLVTVGIGGLILNYRGFFRAEEMYGLIILVVIEALLLVELARYVERRVSWKH